MRLKLKLTMLFLLITTVLSGCNKLPFSNNQNNPSPTPTGQITGTPETPAPNQTPSNTPTPAVTDTPTPTTSPTKAPAPSPTQAPAPPTNLEKAQLILADLSLEEKVGQMFFVRCIKDQALADIKTYHLGGYILFGDDFKNQTKKEINAGIASYQNKSDIPMLVGVDEEGGTVNRVSRNKAFRAVPFKSPQDLYEEGGFDLIRSDTKEKSELLLSLGINVNLAPVCDVSISPEDFIYKRAFGQDAEQTAGYVKIVVTEMKKAGIGSTLKHFPGYGNNVDTHTGIAIDERSLKSFEENDFLPFQAGINAGAGSILVSHNIVKSMDENYPASLSKKVHDILRKNLGFNGVVMTDDLSMDAIKNYTNDEEAAVLAISAGNDLVVATDYNVQIPAVLKALKEGTLTENRIDESVLRILTWKLELGIIK